MGTTAEVWTAACSISWNASKFISNHPHNAISSIYWLLDFFWIFTYSFINWYICIFSYQSTLAEIKFISRQKLSVLKKNVWRRINQGKQIVQLIRIHNLVRLLPLTMVRRLSTFTLTQELCHVSGIRTQVRSGKIKRLLSLHVGW